MSFKYIVVGVGHYQGHGGHVHASSLTPVPATSAEEAKTIADNFDGFTIVVDTYTGRAVNVNQLVSRGSSEAQMLRSILRDNRTGDLRLRVDEREEIRRWWEVEQAKERDKEEQRLRLYYRRCYWAACSGDFIVNGDSFAQFVEDLREKLSESYRNNDSPDEFISKHVV